VNTRGPYMTAKLERVSGVTLPTNHKRQGLFHSSSWDDALAYIIEDNGRILEEMESELDCFEIHQFVVLPGVETIEVSLDH